METTGSLTSLPRGQRFSAVWLASRSETEIETFLNGLSDNALLSLPWLFDFWALEHQVPPAGNWLSWIILGGRGAGKTRAGAEWVRSEVEGSTPQEAGRLSRLALVGETYDQAREIMVFGESGILACSPPDRRPEWQATRRRLVWPNGAVAQVYSASDPEALRGPQFDGAWCDELAKWKQGQDAWDMLQFGLRLGDDPRQLITTTPRSSGLLKALLEDSRTVVTRAPTSANAANLAKGFLERVVARYEGSRLGRQELDGEFIEGAEGALWSHAQLDALRVAVPHEVGRVVVAVDPPVTSGEKADACGIVVAIADTSGELVDWQATILEDASVSGASPQEWAEAAVAAFHRHKADRLVAEVNQGGELVETLIRQIDQTIPFRAVRAQSGKALRAEPVAALYEQGRVKHLGILAALEDQMCLMTGSGFQGQGSPDRVDALVWALSDLMVEPARKWQAPRLRSL